MYASHHILLLKIKFSSCSGEIALLNPVLFFSDCYYYYFSFLWVKAKRKKLFQCFKANSNQHRGWVHWDVPRWEAIPWGSSDLGMSGSSRCHIPNPSLGMGPVTQTGNGIARGNPGWDFAQRTSSAPSSLSLPFMAQGMGREESEADY